MPGAVLVSVDLKKLLYGPCPQRSNRRERLVDRELLRSVRTQRGPKTRRKRLLPLSCREDVGRVEGVLWCRALKEGSRYVNKERGRESLSDEGAMQAEAPCARRDSAWLGHGGRGAGVEFEAGDAPRMKGRSRLGCMGGFVTIK